MRPLGEKVCNQVINPRLKTIWETIPTDIGKQGFIALEKFRRGTGTQRGGTKSRVIWMKSKAGQPGPRTLGQSTKKR